MTLFDKQHNEIVLGDEISRGGEGVEIGRAHV